VTTRPSDPGSDPGHVARTAVILPVPAAEHVVGPHRATLDASAAAGVPAHLTVLHPFVDVAAVDESVLARVAEVVAATPAFTCRFTRCSWFDDDVLWLDPEPAAPVLELVQALWAAFPDHPPYAGAHDEVVAHVTIGETAVGGLAALREAEAAVTAQLPVEAVLDHALVIGELEPGTWQTIARLQLAPPAPPAPPA